MSNLWGGSFGNIALAKPASAGSSVPVLAGPLYDGFSGSGGLSTARALDGGNGTWSFGRYAGTGETFAITGGALTGSGTNPFQGLGYVTLAGTDRLWSRRTANTVGAIGQAANTWSGADHITIGTNVANWIVPQFSLNTGAITSLVAAYASQAGTLVGTIATLVNAQQRAGDQLGIRYRNLRTTPELAVYHNGRRMTAWSAINTTTNPVTGQMGARGATACAFDDILVGDADTMRMLDVVCQGRIWQRDPSTGNVVARMVIDCTPDVPAASALNYTIVDVASRTPISGHNQQPVTGFVSGSSVPAFDSDALKAQFQIGALASPPAGGFFVEVRRTDIQSGTSLGRTPFILAGDNILGDGQSITCRPYSSTGGLPPAVTPVNCGRLDASQDAELTAGGFQRFRFQRTATAEANGAVNQLFGALQSANGGVPVQLLMAGFSNSLLWERNNSPTYASSYKAARNIAIADAGFAVRWAFQTGHQYEVNVPESGGSPYGPGAAGIIAARNDYPNQIRIWADEIDALLLRPAKFMIVPLTVVLGTPDVDSQEFRRMQKQLCDAFPTRFFLGPFNFLCEVSNLDDRVSGRDNYHKSKTVVLPGIGQVQSGDGRLFNDIGRRINALEGWAAHDFNGPSLTAARISGNTIICTYIVPGGSLNVRNTGYLGDFRCGHDFGTTSSFGTQLLPTGAAVTAANEVTFTFASAPPAGACVRVGYGSYPYAREATTSALHIGGGTSATTNAVYLNPAERAAMVCADYNTSPAVKDWAPTKPSIDIGGPDIDHVVCS